MNETRHYVM